MGTKWKELSVSLRPEIRKTLKKMNFATTTPVQEATIPLFMKNKDVVVEAVTGSGKTLAFVIPTIEILLRRSEPWRRNEVGAVLVSPTRELAHQISQVVGSFLEHLPHLKQQLLIGGSSNAEEDLKDFQDVGANILVSTPGRLEAVLTTYDYATAVKSLEVLVLDEADRLLDMGFETTLNTILSYFPKQRRTGLFSATQTEQLEDLIRAGLRNPVRVNVKDKREGEGEVSRTPSTLSNYYLLCPSDDKLNLVVDLLRRHAGDKIMVFFSTCACADYFGQILKRLLPKSTVLVTHRKKNNRNKTFQQFKDLTSGVLVCTDVMGRGVDIPLVHWVIQFDAPTSPSNFVHRCGRTARIGNIGNSLLLLRPSEETFVDFISINQKVQMELMPIPVDVQNILPQVQKMISKDRSLYDKSLRAFVSFVQSYAKHECHLIFRVKDLDLGLLGRGYALLQLPRMPELKGKAVTFDKFPVDVTTIPYPDKHMEKMRQEKLQIPTEQRARKPRKTKTEAWSKNKEKRTQKTDKKRRRTRDQQDDEDIDQLANDARMVKKLKKRQISVQAFDSYISSSAAEHNVLLQEADEELPIHQGAL